MTTTTLHLEGYIAPQQEKTYLHLPFDLPAPAARLEVVFRYDHQIGSSPTLTGGNTLDLGIFDERGIDFLTAGFRGWTGSERPVFFISEREATPGYLPGPLNPGRWHLLLGAYKIGPEGCHYQADITITPREAGQPGLAALPTAPPLPVPAHREAARWLRGELHCHTWHSDGSLSPAALVEHARALGLDFLAVADHNNIAAQPELAALTEPGLVLIHGIEVTTFKGHFNAWGIPDWVDFRVQQPEQMRAALQFANQRGALTSCGHPKPFGPDWDYPEVTNYACVEVWNGPWTGLNEMSLEFWLEQLKAGRRLTAVGGSDFHRPPAEPGIGARDLGAPTNWVYLTGASPDPATAILDAIRRGRVSLSAVPNGPFIDLRGGPAGDLLPGDTFTAPAPYTVQVHCQRAAGLTDANLVLRLLDSSGLRHEQPITQANQTVEIRLPDAAGYLRAELRDADERLWAMTNPIYR